MLLVTIAFSAWSAAAFVRPVDIVDVDVVCGPSVPCPIVTTAGTPASTSVVAGGTQAAVALRAVAANETKQGEARAPAGELARFTTSDNVRLEATFHAVPRAKDPLPAVLLVHDLGADQAQLAPLIENLLKRKLAVLTFDLRGHGVNRTDTLDWSALDEEGRARLAPFMLNDVQAALNWLGNDPRVLGGRLHLVGQGFGSLLALRSVRDERVTSLTLTLPADDLHGCTLRTLLPDTVGLATQIITTSDDQKRMQDMLEEADLSEDISLVHVKAEPEEILRDRRLPNTLTKWIDDNRNGLPVRRTRG